MNWTPLTFVSVQKAKGIGAMKPSEASPAISISFSENAQLRPMNLFFRPSFLASFRIVLVAMRVC